LFLHYCIELTLTQKGKSHPAFSGAGRSFALANVRYREKPDMSQTCPDCSTATSGISRCNNEAGFNPYQSTHFNR
jgi:hypothetical protein